MPPGVRGELLPAPPPEDRRGGGLREAESCRAELDWERGGAGRDSYLWHQEIYTGGLASRTSRSSQVNISFPLKMFEMDVKIFHVI